MDVRRATYWAAIRLAIVLSTVASVIALGLDAVGDVSPTALVLTVIVVGFTMSWRRTGRIARMTTIPDRVHDRRIVVPVRHPIG
jgi:hypothetical protein